MANWLLPRSIKLLSKDRQIRWLFSREDQQIELTIYADRPSHFGTVVRWPNGRQDAERFVTLESLRLHLAGLRRQLRVSDFSFGGASLEHRND
jgi:hypothetical protein